VCIPGLAAAAQRAVLHGLCTTGIIITTCLLCVQVLLHSSHIHQIFITYSSDIHQFILCCQRFVKVSNLFAEFQVCPACACSGGGSVPSRISLPNAAEQLLQKLKDMLQEWTC
jgi:uncharacterized protein with PIN domain